MEGFILLSALSFAMFIGSYIAGSLPLVVSFSESRLRLITVLGAGLLVGTALAVIIPEGVQSVYAAQSQSMKALTAHGEHETIPVQHNHVHDHNHPNVIKHKLPPESRPIAVETRQNAIEVNKVAAPDKQDVVPASLDLNLPKRKKREITSEEMIPRLQQKHVHEEEDKGNHNHNHKGSDVHSAVGLALVAGFVLMLLVDQLAQHRSVSGDAEAGGSVQPRYKITATIGLVVHAAADGVALGAASGSSHTDVQFIVFVAIMLHKAPASFGLVTFLLHEGLDKSRIRKHLLIFALSAPIAAVITFIFITQGGHESLTSLHTTGVLLLFSAGTFLYVATVHVLPEVAAAGHSHGGSTSGPQQQGGFKLNELIALVVGAVAPTILTVGHSH